MRYLASVVTQCFTAFGELLGMQKRLAELSGGVGRVGEMMDAMAAAAAQEAAIRSSVTEAGAHSHLKMIYFRDSESSDDP